MIRINSSESIIQNFKSVIEYARTTYKASNVHTKMLESINLDSYQLLEGILLNESEVLNEEATNVTDAKIIHDGKGTAISVKINGKEYRYVSATKSTADLYRSFMGMLKHANAGYKALNWLKRNALEYYGSKKPSEEGRKLLGLSESARTYDYSKSTQSMYNKAKKCDIGDLTAQDVYSKNQKFKATVMRIAKQLGAGTMSCYRYVAIVASIMTKLGIKYTIYQGVADPTPDHRIAKDDIDSIGINNHVWIECNGKYYETFNNSSGIQHCSNPEVIKLSESCEIHHINESKYYRYHQLSKKAKDKANEDYFRITEDNDPSAAEYYYQNCNPNGQGGAFLFTKDGTPIYDEDVYESATQPSDIPPSDADDEIKIRKPVNEAVITPSSEVFRTDKSGMSYYDEFLDPKEHDYKRLVKGLQGEIVYIAPQEYIKRLGTDIFKCSYDRVMRGVDMLNVEAIATDMEHGKKYDIPVLDLANRTQEGRHRAIAADKLGIKKIPVLVVTEWDAHKELGMPKSMNLWYGHTIQWINKKGDQVEFHVGLDLEKVRKKVAEIVKSGDYQK